MGRQWAAWAAWEYLHTTDLLRDLRIRSDLCHIIHQANITMYHRDFVVRIWAAGTVRAGWYLPPSSTIIRQRNPPNKLRAHRHVTLLQQGRYQRVRYPAARPCPRRVRTWARR